MPTKKKRKSTKKKKRKPAYYSWSPEDKKKIKKYWNRIHRLVREDIEILKPYSNYPNPDSEDADELRTNANIEMNIAYEIENLQIKNKVPPSKRIDAREYESGV